MTVRQLHYTSCEDGLEGIQGFQVSAMTSGIPKPLVELAVRSSGYDAGPALVDHLGDGDVSGFPVAFGYVANGDTAALFQSRYAGTDFTGRTGNYFAHALLLDDPERDLAGLLPIDLWRSPDWVDSRPSTGTELPALRGLQAGKAADAESTMRFLAEPGRLRDLRRLLTAVQPLLATGRGRLVLTVPDDSAAAMWLAALSRSLPRALSLRVSFTTYTARPENQEVMVSCTTPDVRLPAYGDFTVLDLTKPGSDDRPARYATVLADAWPAGSAGTAVRLAEQVDPPLSGAELDTFAAVLELNAGSHTDERPLLSTDERQLLAAVALGMERPQLRFSADVWQRVSDQVQDTGGPRDLAAWSMTLQSALRRGEPVPATLLGTFLVAALTAPADANVPRWLPRLDPADLDDVAENVVLPAVTGDRPEPALLRRLSGQPALIEALGRVLNRRAAEHAELERLTITLPPELAKSLPGQTGPVALLRDLVLARAGERSRVRVLAGAARDDLPHWRRLGPLLWPGELPADDTLALLRTVPPAVLDGTGLAGRIIEQVVRARDPQLVGVLRQSPLGEQLTEPDYVVLMAVHLTSSLRQATPDPGSSLELADALHILENAPPDLAGPLLDSMVAFVLRAPDPALHTVLLEQALSNGQFLGRYREHVRAELAKAGPDQVAATILAWYGLSDAKIGRGLLDKTLPAALSRRRTKYLNKVGTHLTRLSGKGSRRAKELEKLWLAWRMSHERRGLLGLRRGMRMSNGRRGLLGLLRK
jgi:GTPase-associated protein 1, N-terminal domain type 2/GTPase-associated protein 1, middle domain